MNDFLKKIGLIDSFRMELPLEKAEFVKILRNNIDPAGENMFEVFSSSKNIYKGRVDLQGFELKRRRKFFDTRYNYAKANATFTQLGHILRIDTEINGFPPTMIMVYILAFLVYALAIGLVLFSDSFEGADNAPVFILPFILLHGAFMFFLPYFLLKRGVRLMKHDLERELYYLVREK